MSEKLLDAKSTPMAGKERKSGCKPSVKADYDPMLISLMVELDGVRKSRICPRLRLWKRMRL